jgi:DNA/RNA endonuclease YhcR with UshA esterase domain
MLQEGYKLKKNYVSNNKCEQSVSGGTYSITNANDFSETTSIEQVPRFLCYKKDIS